MSYTVWINILMVLEEPFISEHDEIIHRFQTKLVNLFKNIQYIPNTNIPFITLHCEDTPPYYKGVIDPGLGFV